jgi:hypothetical protein
VRFEVGQPATDAIVKLNAKIAANMDRIPPGVSPPLIKVRSIDDVPILALTLHSAFYDHATLRRVAAQLDDAVKQVEGVSETTLIGGLARRVRVAPDRAALAARGLSLTDVAYALRQANQPLPAGAFATGDREFLVETGAFLKNADQVAAVVLGVYAGRPVRLGEVAAVRDGPDEPDQYVFFRAGQHHAAAAPMPGAGSVSQGSPFEPAVTLAIAKRMGASMIKLLVYYHPDSPTAPGIEAFVRQVADECARCDLGIMLEPLSYSLDSQIKLSSAEKRYVVTETARRLVIPGIDVLKVEFPLDIAENPNESTWAAACARISVASPAPWILLSAAVDFETYFRQVKIACKTGASGSAVGRAVWQEAVNLPGEARLAFLRTTGRERMARLTELCSELGKPVSDFYNADAPFDWYKTY